MTAEALVPPAARQGPGPVPRPAVERLALSLARRAAGVLNGATAAPGAGDGTELETVREYQYGDDVRWLDPAASARTGVPHVRRYVPERSLTTWIVLDVSPSMAWGSAQRLKSDVAEGAVSVLGELAVRQAGQVGLVRCGGPGAAAVLPPRGGRAALVALRRRAGAGVVADGQGRDGALPEALRSLAAIARRPGLVAVVSDFPAHPALKGAVAALAERHTVIAVEVRDPREVALPPVRHLALVDPETGEHAEVDVDDGVRRRFAASVAEERAAMRSMLARLRAVHVVVSTDAPWLPALGRRLA
jgi:uncharacterized protein (DUF58 family)